MIHKGGVLRVTETQESRIAILETEMKNEVKNREELEARLVTRMTKTETNIRNGAGVAIGLLAKATFDWLKGGL